MFTFPSLTANSIQSRGCIGWTLIIDFLLSPVQSQYVAESRKKVNINDCFICYVTLFEYIDIEYNMNIVAV